MARERQYGRSTAVFNDCITDKRAVTCAQLPPNPASIDDSEDNHKPVDEAVGRPESVSSRAAPGAPSPPVAVSASGSRRGGVQSAGGWRIS